MADLKVELDSKPVSTATQANENAPQITVQSSKENLRITFPVVESSSTSSSATGRHTTPCKHNFELVILCGLPGSGKSTFTKKLQAAADKNDGGKQVIVLAQDELGKCGILDPLGGLFKTGGSKIIVVDRTNLTAKARKEIKSLCFDPPKSSILCIDFETPACVCQERVKQRLDHPILRFGSGASVVEAFVKAGIERPSEKEGMTVVRVSYDSDKPNAEADAKMAVRCDNIFNQYFGFAVQAVEDGSKMLARRILEPVASTGSTGNGDTEKRNVFALASEAIENVAIFLHNKVYQGAGGAGTDFVSFIAGSYLISPYLWNLMQQHSEEDHDSTVSTHTYDVHNYRVIVLYYGKRDMVPRVGKLAEKFVADGENTISEVLFIRVSDWMVKLSDGNLWSALVQYFAQCIQCPSEEDQFIAICADDEANARELVRSHLWSLLRDNVEAVDGDITSQDFWESLASRLAPSSSNPEVHRVLTKLFVH